MGVQPLPFGQSLPSRGGEYLRLKNKGDQVQFLMAQEPVYTGKHFQTNEDGSWNVTDCPRIQEGDDCELCEKFFEIKSLVKQFKAAENAKDDHPEVKRMNNEARNYAVAIQFYFPILDRGDGKFKILQTTNGVRGQFNDHFESGVEVMKKEWILRNTGEVGGKKYALSMVDSADAKPLSDEEKEEFEKAKAYDLSQISNSGSSEDEE
jgi:hypothetical protein